MRRRTLLTILLLTLLPAGADAQRPGWLLAVPDVSQHLGDLPTSLLEGPVPILMSGAASPAMRERARRLQIGLLEARAFWQNLLGSAPAGAVLFVPSDLWTALRPDRAYGSPGVQVREGTETVYAVLASGDSTDFGVSAGQLASTLAPLGLRGMLVANGLADRDGAEAYAHAWRWVLLGEGLAEGLRIGARTWWQRRIVGAAAAWLLLDAPRGDQVAPGDAVALESWAWFLQRYFADIAVPLDAADRRPPEGDPRTQLELEARLLEFGRDLLRANGMHAFELLRAAWPYQGGPEGVEDGLVELLMRFPGLKDWYVRLLDPTGERRLEPPPGVQPS